MCEFHILMKKQINKWIGCLACQTDIFLKVQLVSLAKWEESVYGRGDDGSGPHGLWLAKCLPLANCGFGLYRPMTNFYYVYNLCVYVRSQYFSVLLKLS